MPMGDAHCEMCRKRVGRKFSGGKADEDPVAFAILAAGSRGVLGAFL